ncbi:hypothetical protein GGS23DRAFT_604757 [Durotheca rogersii]|uniref:uncharacterized protein n=1 Tax=Durotheca rogersii TaxID=419775 RepID=UPI002220F273|nr:uncharacterized protein GGS23DRAFT_604757 [Durotheca rogersii]KAI5863746.1 hypothetical protein GGS23DRAFT_604757 [Durotheca rogersii]
MLAGRDRLVRVESGETCFYGAYSELSFILRTLELFEEKPDARTNQTFLVVNDMFNLPLASPAHLGLGSATRIPSCEICTALVEAVFARNHPMLSFLPKHRIRRMSTLATELAPVPLSDQSFYLFDSRRHRAEGCRVVLQRATGHFHAGMALLRPMERNDLVSLQAVLCAIVFLISTSRIVVAHSLIAAACSSVVRLGLHATGREKIRAYATVLRLDFFASIILNLPPFFQKDAVPLSRIARLASRAEAEKDLPTAAALRQVCLLAIPLHKTIGTSADGPDGEDSQSVDIRDLEESQTEFHGWKTDASSLLACLGRDKEHWIIKHDLEMTYNFGQIILCRPFLHYLRVMADGGSISITQSYHALACIKLASSTIVRAQEMMDEGPVLAGFWPSIYTVFLSVMCLVFLIAAHRGTSTPSRAWQRAAAGIRVIAALKCVDDCSKQCLEVLKVVTDELSHTVYFDFDELEASVIRNCGKRTSREASYALSPLATEPMGDPSSPLSKYGNRPPDASSLAVEDFVNIYTVVESNEADRMLDQAEELSTEFDFGGMSLELSGERHDSVES